MAVTSVDLCGITLDNPIIPASGTFGYGYEFAEIYNINCLGTFSFKGQNKTQVFPLPGSVFVHNRLTHSLEVSSVQRRL